MFAFFRIERPTNATLRPQSTPTSAACCIRCTFEANEETRIRPSRLGKIWRNASPTTRSDSRDAGPLRVRRVAEQEVDAAVADLREPADVGALAVDRRVVELVVARVDAAAARRLEHDRGRIRDRVRHADELDAGTGRARTGSSPGASSRSSAARRSPCSSSFDLTSASVSRVASDERARAPRASGTGGRRRDPRARA